MKNNDNTESKIIKLFGENYDKKFSFDRLKELLPKTTRKEKLIHAILVLKKQKRIKEVDFDVYQLNDKKEADVIVTRREPKIEKPVLTEIKDKISEGKEKSRLKANEIDGVLDITSSGASFVSLEGYDRDAILRGNAIPAFSGDTIRVRVDKVKEGKRPEVTFIKVVARKHRKFIGKFTVQKSKEYDVYFVEPVSVRSNFDFYIASKHIGEAKDGNYVEVEFIDWSEKEKNPRGLVTKVFQNFNPNELTMQSILIEREFSEEFPQSVIDEVEPVSNKIPASEIENRLDLRKSLTITIDPKTARDFDDALSLEKLEDGTYEIGVHIADVSHFVAVNTELDKEAYRRATSVYLPDRVAPMLPEKLSNDLCSLNPNVDRLAFSMMYHIDDSGKIIEEYLAKTIIHSDQRFTYEDAQKIIETGKGELAEEVLIFHKIATIWRKDRFSKGAINFESPEVQFVLDESKKPIDIIPKVQKEANWLIEEFMLRANVSVARALDAYTKKKLIPAGVYRDHDVPDMQKLEQFRESALKLGGHKLKKFEKAETAAQTLNDFLASISDLPESNILNQLAIRSMAKAYYSTENIGHYGLGYTHYSHFTSPIRRYPDLLAHRLLTDVLKKKKIIYTAQTLEEMCQYCSVQEKKATDCERDGIRYKQVEYLSYHIGEQYDGIVSGMNGNGFWVELIANKCEGYVEIFQNFSESFTFDPNTMTLKGSKSGRSFHMGQTVIVRVDSVDMDLKRVAMGLVV